MSKFIVTPNIILFEKYLYNILIIVIVFHKNVVALSLIIICSVLFFNIERQ